jgi:chemotaxis signal transduction protein
MSEDTSVSPVGDFVTSIPDTITLLVGSVGERAVALSITDARGVSTASKLTRIPGSSQTIAGLVYFRGGIEAIIDLSAIWNGREGSSNQNGRAVLIEAEGMRGVILFDRLWDLFDSPKSSIKQYEGSMPGIIGTVVWRERELLVIGGSELLRYLSSITN